MMPVVQLTFQRNFIRSVHLCARTHKSNDSGLKYDSLPISRYPIPEVGSLPHSIQKRINETSEKTGFVPNVMKAYAHRPAEFDSFFTMYDAIMQKGLCYVLNSSGPETGNLTKADREMIVVATSSYNNCLYCVVSHSALHRLFSKDPIKADQLAACWEASTINDRERAILELAMAVCKSEEIPQVYFDNLYKHGLDAEDAWDIASVAAFFSMSNRMAHFMNMRPNEEFYMMGRIPKPKT